MKKRILFILVALSLLVSSLASASEKSVVEIKTRLQELTYYSEKETFSEKASVSYRSTIRLFQRFNGLPETGIADNETLRVLYSETAVGYDEYIKAYNDNPEIQPEITLFIPKTAYSQWELSGSTAFSSFQVQNTSPTKTVSAFELTVSTYDPWGNCLTPTDYTVTTIKDVAPGKTIYSNDIALPQRLETYDIHVSISKIMYEDGTIIKIPAEEQLVSTWGGPIK